MALFLSFCSLVVSVMILIKLNNLPQGPAGDEEAIQKISDDLSDINEQVKKTI